MTVFPCHPAGQGTAAIAFRVGKTDSGLPAVHEGLYRAAGSTSFPGPYPPTDGYCPGTWSLGCPRLEEPGQSLPSGGGDSCHASLGISAWSQGQGLPIADAKVKTLSIPTARMVCTVSERVCDPFAYTLRDVRAGGATGWSRISASPCPSPLPRPPWGPL